MPESETMLYVGPCPRSAQSVVSVFLYAYACGKQLQNTEEFCCRMHMSTVDDSRVRKSTVVVCVQVQYTTVECGGGLLWYVYEYGKGQKNTEKYASTAKLRYVQELVPSVHTSQNA